MIVVYTDEWWVTMGTPAEAWKHKILKTPQQAFVAGISTGLKPAARDLCFALLHTGNENGCPPNARLIFLCKKNAVDAHDKIGGEIYGQYLKDQALLILPPDSVMVLAMGPATAAVLKTFHHCLRRKTNPGIELHCIEELVRSTCIRSI
jgi:hypothetical protein